MLNPYIAAHNRNSGKINNSQPIFASPPQPPQPPQPPPQYGNISTTSSSSHFSSPPQIYPPQVAYSYAITSTTSTTTSLFGNNSGQAQQQYPLQQPFNSNIPLTPSQPIYELQPDNYIDIFCIYIY